MHLQQLVGGQGQGRSKGGDWGGLRVQLGQHAIHRRGLTLPTQPPGFEAEGQTTFLKALHQGGQGTRHGAEGGGIPKNGLVLAEPLKAAAVQAATAPLLGPEAGGQRLARDLIWGHHHQITQPQGLGRQGFAEFSWPAAGLEHQERSPLRLRTPDLPPGAGLALPERLAKALTQALPPQLRQAATGGGGETLHQTGASH